MSPKVTVLMSVYNGEDHLTQSIESILLQTYKDFEFIIINDGSTDDTLKIITSFNDSRIKIINQKNAGLTKSLNRGLSLVKSDFIARIDADDISHPERISKQIHFLQSNPDIVLVGSNAIIIDENGNRLGKTHFPYNHDELIEKMIELISPFPHASVFFRQKVALDMGGYNERFLRGQDFDLWLRISQKFKIACLKEPLIFLRKSFNSISHSGDISLSYKMGIIALIDYCRRKNKLVSLSNVSDDVWEKFRINFDQWFRKHKYDKKAGAKKHFKAFGLELKNRNLLRALRELVYSFRLAPLFFTYKGIGIKVPEDIKQFLRSPFYFQ